MVVSSPIDPALIVSKRSRAPAAGIIPVIDLRMERSKLCELMVKACEEFYFFQVENHGVSREIICRVEREGQDFFSKPGIEKQKARPVAPTDPFGYGCKNIGMNGDKGELEYILLQANPHSISEKSKLISTTNPKNFSCAVNDYIEGVRKLACEILDILGEGCCSMEEEKIKYSIFSHLIGDVINSDSCFRINHYPVSSSSTINTGDDARIGFGEHSDPQIITILRSIEIGGLQIMSRDANSWIPVPPDTDKFCVIVGDAFQEMRSLSGVARFNNLRQLVLAFNMDFKSDLLSLSLVLEMCPVLQEFHLLTLSTQFSGEQVKRNNALSKSQLKKVEWSGFRGTDNEMSFAKYILKSIRTLEQMYICNNFHFCLGSGKWYALGANKKWSDDRREMMCEWLQRQAISKNAQVIYRHILADSSFF